MDREEADVAAIASLPLIDNVNLQRIHNLTIVGTV